MPPFISEQFNCSHLLLHRGRSCRTRNHPPRGNCEWPETRWKDQRVHGKAKLNIDWDHTTFISSAKKSRQTNGRSLEREREIGRQGVETSTLSRKRKKSSPWSTHPLPWITLCKESGCALLCWTRTLFYIDTSCSVRQTKWIRSVNLSWSR